MTPKFKGVLLTWLWMVGAPIFRIFYLIFFSLKPENVPKSFGFLLLSSASFYFYDIYYVERGMLKHYYKNSTEAI